MPHTNELKACRGQRRHQTWQSYRFSPLSLLALGSFSALKKEKHLLWWNQNSALSFQAEWKIHTGPELAPEQPTPWDGDRVKDRRWRWHPNVKTGWCSLFIFTIRDALSAIIPQGREIALVLSCYTFHTGLRAQRYTYIPIQQKTIRLESLQAGTHRLAFFSFQPRDDLQETKSLSHSHPPFVMRSDKVEGA